MTTINGWDAVLQCHLNVIRGAEGGTQTCAVTMDGAIRKRANN